MFTVEEPEQEFQPGTVLDVHLQRKTGEGFGLNIVGGTDSREFGSDTSIFISSINTNGPAANCGQLDVGDRLLQINDFSLVGVTHSEAVGAFREAGTTVMLKIEKFGQQLLVAKLSTDKIDGPFHAHPSSSSSYQDQIKNFLNSWAGAMLIGTTAGMIAMFTFSKLWRTK